MQQQVKKWRVFMLSLPRHEQPHGFDYGFVSRIDYGRLIFKQCKVRVRDHETQEDERGQPCSANESAPIDRFHFTRGFLHGR
jgi:hypothetical protein